MRFLFIRAEKASYPVTILCSVLDVTRSGYYAFEKRSPSDRAQANTELLVKIKAVHKKSKSRYGAPRVHRELKKHGVVAGRQRVARLMSEHGLQARPARAFCRTTDSDHGLPVAENILDRCFKVDAPDRAWVTDITYVPTGEGWLYLAVVIDLFSRRVLGTAMSESIDRRLVLEALRKAVRLRRPGAGLLHHSDRGSQYASNDYQEALAQFDMRCSMSRRGNCWDNAVAESFFSTLKFELVHGEQYRTRAQAEQSIEEYIERFYNVDRLHSSLGYLSPIEYELMAKVTKSAA